MARRWTKCRPTKGQAWHRHRSADLQGLPRYPGLRSLAAFGQLWRAAPEALVCQYRDQGPKASDVLYIAALAAPNTIDTIPEKTLLAFADHGKLAGTLPRDGGDCETVLDNFRKAGIDLEQLAADLQSRVPSPSMNRGKTCSAQSSPRARSCSTLPEQ